MFPELYMNGDKPAKYRAIDKERFSLSTPAYGFGWLLSSVELYQALRSSKEPPMKTWLLSLPELVEKRIYPRWKTKGYNRRYR
jgi:hypothetical protein